MFSTRSRILLGRIVGIALILYVILVPPPPLFGEVYLNIFELIGYVFLCTAAIGRIWCACFITGKKNTEVVNAGPYSVVRNPLYVFSFIGIVGFGLAAHNPILAFALGIFFIAYYTVIVKKEERFLQSTFGESYRQYLASTPRWIPNFKLYRDCDLVTISPARVRHEILDAVWFLWAFFLWEMIETVRQFRG